jgi:hypothetical protein
MNSKDRFNKWKKYQVLKKKRDLQKQANIYFKLTTEMFKNYDKIKEENKDERFGQN